MVLGVFLFCLVFFGCSLPYSAGWHVRKEWNHGSNFALPNVSSSFNRISPLKARSSALSVESSRDYASKLDDFYVRTRTLFLNGEIDDKVSYRLISAILRMNEQNPNDKITFYINSPGGSVSAGFAVYDMLQSLNMPVETVCLGQAASMGAFLLASGTKGMRCAMPNSRIMIHQPLGGAHGEVSDIKIQANEILQIRQILNAHLSHITGKPIEQIERDCDRDNYMRPAEALEYGLIDRICTTRTSHIVVGPACTVE
ncbi:ATP-dependent Clp protease proteolytic subunit [Babesia sp. Xinjiang]|uniref:ATP-dependent Clp protease proteolytic subunit n=1 Tax=Babesia sp. Xinjiang TaxID=462227 RepID=UPI000A249BB9|nr:ATP-dependent Clp protease proteolytic subunit [Babesia sp. Xinjiang]ORM40743.1 ATP-dependent Clp protease proteolytic subunit [Babesia sp. Xinjiang]